MDTLHQLEVYIFLMPQSLVRKFKLGNGSKAGNLCQSDTPS